jgi:hypothetical protein
MRGVQTLRRLKGRLLRGVISGSWVVWEMRLSNLLHLPMLWIQKYCIGLVLALEIYLTAVI